MKTYTLYEKALKQVALMREGRYQDLVSKIKAREELTHKPVTEEDIILFVTQL